MRQEGRAPNLPRFGFEHIDEQLADGLALDFGVAHAGQPVEEQRRGIHMDQRNIVGLAEQAHYLVGLALAHQTVVDEDAGQLLADRLMDQNGGDRRIDPARQPADHPVETHLLLDLEDHLGLEMRHRPVALAAADFQGEIAQEPRTIGRVDHLHVELGGIELPRLVGDGGKGRAFAGGDHLEAWRNGGDPIAVTHPNLVALAHIPYAVEQRIGGLDLDEGLAEFAVVRAFDLATQLGAHGLLAVADAEDGKPALEHPLGRAGRRLVMHRGRASRQDDALEPRPVQCLFSRLERHDLRIDPGLADAPGDELCDLGAEVDDQDTVLHGGRLREDGGVRKMGWSGRLV